MGPGNWSEDAAVLPFACGNLVGGLGVVLGNGLIVAATLRSKALRSNCNRLICILAALDLISGVCFLQQAVLVLTGNLEFSQQTCGQIWALLFFSLDAGSALILGVGFDRFASLSFPIWYKHLDRRLYLGTVVGLSLTFGASVAVAALSQTQQTSVICIPPTALSGSAFLYWVGSNLAINTCVVVVYVLAFRRAKQLRDAELRALGSGGRSASRKTEQKHALMLSLVLVVHVFICSWLATIAILGLSQALPLDPLSRFHVQAYCGWLVLVNCGSNAIIYAWRSELYRTEMSAVLGLGRREAKSALLPPSAVYARYDERRPQSFTVPCPANYHLHRHETQLSPSPSAFPSPTR